MPRKQPLVPLYEIPTAGGILRVKLCENQRSVMFEYATTQTPGMTFLLDAKAWCALTDLRGTLMPKRARKVKVAT